MNGFFDPSKYQEQVSIMSERYTRLPNYVIDSGLMAELSDKAFKCYMLITRYTTGYNKVDAQIATTTFQKYCGIKKGDTVFAAIKELEQCNLIRVERKTGVLNTYFLLQNGLYSEQNQSHNKGLPNNGTTPIKRDGSSPIKRDGTTPIKRDTYKEKYKENFKENICEVFEFWKTTFGKTEKTVLSDKRKSKIQARLKQGYSVDDLKLAITNCCKSDYHVQNGYTDIELICREPEKLDRFMAMFPVADAEPDVNQPKPPQQNYIAEPMEW